MTEPAAPVAAPNPSSGTPPVPPAGDPPPASPPASDTPPAAAPPAGDPPKTPEPPKDGAPEVYDFKPQKDQQFEPEFVKAYSEVAKELNLSQEAAQKILDKVSPVVQQQQLAQVKAIRDKWAEDSKADKEFGGDKLPETLSMTTALVSRFGTQAYRDFLNVTGVGDHPEVVRFHYQMAKAIFPDNFVGGHQQGQGDPKTFSDQASVLYPSSKK